MSAKQRGILVIAHGSSDSKWVDDIEEAATKVHSPYPLSVSYLELVPDKSIADGVHHLEQLGAQQILAIPLFVSSGSTHLEEIKYALGVIQSSRIETDMERIHPQADIIWAQAMDDHRYIIDILIDRVRTLSTHPAQEEVLLVAHGSDKPGFVEVWMETLENIARQIKQRMGFQDVQFATIYPDTIAHTARAMGVKNRVIVLPVFLSAGYYTSKVIPAKLEGLDYIYTGQSYLPHALIHKWMEEQVHSYF